VPTVISFPHFLGADPDVRNGVVGMKPDEVKHSAHVHVEPVIIVHYLHIAGLYLSSTFVLGRSRYNNYPNRDLVAIPRP
jgi:hypothetical protein